MIQAIFFDIDGTLQTISLDGKPVVPESTKFALAKLREKGIKLFICSGRPPVFKEMIENNCDFIFDGYVMMNGQYVLSNEDVVYKQTLQKEDVKRVIPFLVERNISTLIAEEDYVYRVQEIQSEKQLGAPNIDSYQRIYNHDVYMMMVMIDEKDTKTEHEFFQLASHSKAARWLHTYTDVIDISGGKDVGMDQLLKYYGIPLENTMGFGDGGNDIPMLEHSAIGVVMGNANETVKEHGDYITESIDQDGLYNALVHFSVLEDNFNK